MNPSYNSGGYQQGGYPQDRPGLADSYYSGGPSEPQQHQYPPQGQPEYGQHPQQYQQHHSVPPPYYSPQNPGSYDQGYPTQYDNQSSPDGERGVMGALAGGAAGAFGGHKVGGKVGYSKTSTVIGAVAGAIAGHKLQDAVSDWKDKRDEEKQEHQHGHHHSPPNHHFSHHDDDEKPRSGNFAGNFTASSRDIRLDAHGEYNLHASCRRSDGSYQQSTISLNRILENDGGSFRWATGGSTSTVAVQQGDTLRGIAARFNCSFEDIARHNNISNPDMIYPGQVLQIPGGGSGGGNFGASARDVRLVEGGQRLEGELLRDGHWVRSSIVLDERISNGNGTLQHI